MNLVRRLVANDTFIEGIPKEELKQILSQTHPSIRTSTIRHGNIILSNNKIIKCIHRYYLNQEGAPARNMTCFYCQKYFDVEVTPFSCLACHLRCLEKLGNKELYIK